jgi:hypothetical protein
MRVRLETGQVEGGFVGRDAAIELDTVDALQCLGLYVIDTSADIRASRLFPAIPFNSECPPFTSSGLH